MTTDERMEKMEGQLARVRWFNRCLIVCIVLSLGAWFILNTFGSERVWSQSGAKEIRANCFILEDENGKRRALLGMGMGGPSLMLLDENGKSRAVLAVIKEGPSLGLLDENGKSRALLAASKDGLELSMYDENGENRAKLIVAKDVLALGLRDENNKLRAMLAVLKDIGPGLSLYDENENLRVQLGKGQTHTPDGKVTIYPESSLILCGADGKVSWAAP